MKNQNGSPEEKADFTLESLEGMQQVEIPGGLEEKMFARFDREFSAVAKTPKWFWAAAVLLLAINLVAVAHYSGTTKKEISAARSTTGIDDVASYYFQGGTDWYQN